MPIAKNCPMSNQREYTINGIDIRFILDTKHHVWNIAFDGEPVLRFTRAKGYAIIRFLEKLKESKN